ncbi:hypothetical protein FRC18_002416, partial [Serendipita sp. 400]
MSSIDKFYIPSASTMYISLRPYEEYTKANSLPPVTIVPVSFLMQVQNDNTSLEDLSRYRKLGYEHVEEEKVLLDSLLTLYRKRVEIAQSHLLALEELYSAIMADLDVSNSLYKPLAWPALDCLEKDIESHRHYIHRTQCDLDKVTFPMGPRSIVQSIKEATNAAKRLHPKYADS